MSPRLELSAVHVTRGAHLVIKGVTLQLPPGMIGCLLGPSGCGKTALFRAIAGFEPVSRGAIHIDGAKVASPLVTVPPEDRLVGVVFQDFALFPHLTVAENIAFGLSEIRSGERQGRIAEMLVLFGLGGAAHCHPYQLTADQQRRLAFARAIAPRPRLLLIDEPFADADAENRLRLAHDLRLMLKEAEMTALLATADQQEAFAAADRIGVMSAGVLQQWADAETLYQQPANRVVAQLIGQGVVLSARVGGAGDLLHTPLGDVLLPESAQAPPLGHYVGILVRPCHVRLSADEKSNATLIRRFYRGADVLYVLRLDSGQEISATAPSCSRYPLGERLHASLDRLTPPILVNLEGRV
ncbi:ABC transporter ATP-binding protein [Methylococcus sp. EFPC2]|uniref:ABC transporter ATP-binding protein n=1 Tax=Methylococcus sp. EFPC2 TaxID=2812648 RepID=UPI001967ED43|nr:ABC transporter ATP-binding protein [Methylococcus sp. EFPC2]QSA98299.1 ABC transporter ATP-binding protein [Methylococcus sp. EFPC2]